MHAITFILSTLLLVHPAATINEPQGSARPRSPARPANASSSVRPAPSPADRKPASTDLRLGHFPEQNRRSDHNWSPALTDIARHLPAGAEYDEAYRRFTQDFDLVTAGHEWTHFLNAYLCQTDKTAYYLMDNRYTTLAVPKKLRGHLAEVPDCLRGKLYELYFVTARDNAKIDPLYLFNEWVAYTNDVTVALDQLARGKILDPFMPNATQPLTAGNALEFTYYGCAVGMAVQKYDPEYYAGPAGQQLRAFIAFNALRSLDVYQKALKRIELNQDDTRNPKLLSDFRRSAETAAMRAWIKSELSVDAAGALLGIPSPVKAVADAESGSTVGADYYSGRSGLNSPSARGAQ
jgi:hypothetical protein